MQEQNIGLNNIFLEVISSSIPYPYVLLIMYSMFMCIFPSIAHFRLR